MDKLTLLKALWADLERVVLIGKPDEHFKVTQDQLDALTTAIGIMQESKERYAASANRNKDSLDALRYGLETGRFNSKKENNIRGLRPTQAIFDEVAKVGDTLILYNIWSEGYAATGDSSPAHYFGKSYGRTFKEACKDFFGSSSHHDGYFDEDRMTYWGCKLYDNEEDARRTFG